MPCVLVTGAAGFIGRNLLEALRRTPGVTLAVYDLEQTEAELEAALEKADVIFHLAGVNRPPTVEEFEAGNAGLTRTVCEKLRARGRAPKIVMSSSIQAVLENPYGQSKLHAEEELFAFAADTGAEVVVYRLRNVFGKWCRPNYNSVTATFCHNIARGLPIQISDPSRELELVYIDDIVAAFLGELAAPPQPGGRLAEVPEFHRTTLGALAETLQAFRAQRQTLLLPDFTDQFNKCLYATYLSYLPADEFAYALDQKVDPRGSLAEFVKSPPAGQIFVSRTLPGITRGNHYHHTKTEKFLVLEGDAILRFRHIEGTEIIEYRLSGHEFRVVDIPPGYTHSIENVGATEMVVLFWSSQIFDPACPDTYFCEVLHA